MLSFFREKSSTAVIWTVILFVIVHAQFFFHHTEIITENNNGFLDDLIRPFVLMPSFLASIIYALLILTQALRLNYILNDERMFAKAAFTTAMSYILLTAIYPSWQNISSALICNTCNIWLLHRLFKLYQPATTRGHIFNTGFITGAITLLYHPAFPLIVVAFLALGVLRAFKLNEWLVLLIGMATPFYMLIAFVFLKGNSENVLNYLPKFQFHLLDPENRKLVLSTSVAAAVLLLPGMFVLQQHLPRMIIQVRKNWTIIFLMLLLLVLIIFLLQNAKFETLFIAVIPAATIVSCIFAFPKKNLLPAILFWFALAAVIFNNWFL